MAILLFEAEGHWKKIWPFLTQRNKQNGGFSFSFLKRRRLDRGKSKFKSSKIACFLHVNAFVISSVFFIVSSYAPKRNKQVCISETFKKSLQFLKIIKELNWFHLLIMISYVGMRGKKELNEVLNDEKIIHKLRLQRNITFTWINKVNLVTSLKRYFF